MAPTTSKGKHTVSGARSKSLNASEPQNDQEETVKAMVQLMSMTQKIRKSRRQEIILNHKKQVQKQEKIIQAFYDNAKKQLLKKQKDRIQKLSKLVREQASLESQILTRVRRLELTYAAAKEDVLAVLKGRLEELHGGSQ